MEHINVTNNASQNASWNSTKQCKLFCK